MRQGILQQVLTTGARFGAHRQQAISVFEVRQNVFDAEEVAEPRADTLGRAAAFSMLDVSEIVFVKVQIDGARS